MSFDSDLQATLSAAARDTQVPGGLAERLIVNAQQGRTVVRPITSARHHSRWLTPMLAAAAVLVLAGGVTTVSVLADRHSDGPAAPVRPLPTSPADRTPSVTPSPTQPVTPAPSDFRPSDVQFRDPEHGVALGTGHCGQSAATGCSVTLVATDDGGAVWRQLPVPPGLHTMFPANLSSDGSCADNGDILGPCVDSVLFANDEDGYLYGVHEVYATTDGGTHWTREKVGIEGVTSMASDGSWVYRIATLSQGSEDVPAVLQRAKVGVDEWTDIGPSPKTSWNSTFVASGGVLYFADEPVEQTSGAPSTLWRSTDAGSHWSKVTGGSNLYAAAAGPDGSLGSFYTAKPCSVDRVLTGASTVTGTPSSFVCPADQTVTPQLIGMPTTETFVALVTPEGATQYPVYRSTDGGATFTQVATLQVTNDSYVGRSGFVGQFGWVTTSQNNLAVTRNGGATWQTIGF